MPAASAPPIDTLARLLLRALARREARDLAPRRLIDPGQGAWKQFAHNLEPNHLLALLAEDAATRFPLPADPEVVLQKLGGRGFASVPETTVVGWLRELEARPDGELPEAVTADASDALRDAAQALGLPTRFAGASLHTVAASTRVVELPGTGGMLLHRALAKSPDARLHVNGTVLTSTWQDRALAGLVAMEVDAPGVDYVHHDPDLAWAAGKDQRGRFDLVFGLQPAKGGAFGEAELALRFPAATVVLV